MDLSVIIPAHGVQRHIAACLRSVTRCSGETIDMECIVVSDDSGGETIAVVNRYIERDRRIRLVPMETGGTADARNIGIEAAAGRYILFLGAADRLCEDAWEQIEAAVGEEYADFVAFSYITLRESRNRWGEKLKAQMLPLSDVISTDEGEARRLMYADSVLDSCRGKLFKSRIIRDNNIFFRTDCMPQTEFFNANKSLVKSWDGVDFMFVAEYFEHSESFLLTKAMILYCPPENRNAMDCCSITDRVKLIRVLYDFHVNAVKRYNDSELMECMKIYFLGILTDLFVEYVEKYSYERKAVDALYESALGSEFLKNFLDEVDVRGIRSKTRRYEYRLLRLGNAAKLRRYCAVRTGNLAKIRRYFR